MAAAFGVRIEFYEHLGADGTADGYLGTFVCKDGYRAAHVPRAGDLIAVTSLRAAPMQDAVHLHPPSRAGAGRFPQVRQVEHYPVPERDGQRPQWWDGPSQPGTTVVLHAPLSYAGPALRRFVRQFAEAGWWMDARPDSEMERYWREFVKDNTANT